MATIPLWLRDFAAGRGPAVDMKPGLLFADGAKALGGSAGAEPSPIPKHRREDKMLFRRLRIEDAEADLAVLELLVVRRREDTSVSLPDDFFGWDSSLFGPKPASPEAAVAALRKLIGWDRKVLADLTAEPIPAYAINR